MESLILFLKVCTANPVSFYSCLRVWEYLPAYVDDYIEFKTREPYYKEKEALKNNINLWSLSLIENRSQYPLWGAARSLRSLRFAVQYSMPLRKPAGRGSERVARADVSLVANNSQ